MFLNKTETERERVRIGKNIEYCLAFRSSEFEQTVLLTFYFIFLISFTCINI